MQNPQKVANPTARQAGLVIQEMPDEVLVFDLATDKAHCLNQTAASVWKACDGENSVFNIARILETESGKPFSEELVRLAIDQLSANDLLCEPMPENFNRQSRRQAIKKIGLAAVIVLPVVSSLIAPTAVRAVACSGTVTICTGCPTGTPCTGPTGGAGTCTAGACSGARGTGSVRIQSSGKIKQ